MYRLSPPKHTGFASRVRIVGTVIGSSLVLSGIMGVASVIMNTEFASPGTAHPIAQSQATHTPVLASLAAQVITDAGTTTSEIPEEILPKAEGPIVAKRTVVHPIAAGDSFGGLMTQYGIDRANEVIAQAKPHFDVSKIQAGHHLRIEFMGDTLTRLSYEIDPDRTLQIDFADQQLNVEVQELKWIPQIQRKELHLTSSLWASAIGAGFKPADIVTLAQIFEYDIDFASELRKGAKFTIVMDELHREDGERVKPGTFHAVRLTNSGKEYTAIRYESKKGHTGWYHPDGKATARPFLRSPLEFTRVTSRFGVNRKTHYHGGVDMGAKTGTPIRAAGDGVVVIAGRRGAYGKHVKLSHARYGKYHTSYSHLSKIKVKNGQHVKQGQIIGLVGSTGRSTGPHLHYEFHIRGKRVNPMTVKLPGSKSLPKSEQAAFKHVAAKWLPQLDAIDSEPAVTDAHLP